jgi:hypothetical protein
VSINSKRIIVGSFLCFLICINFISGVNVVTSADENPIIVLFDEAHGQFFNQSFYSQALSELENLGMQIVFNDEIFDENSFEGVDVFISTNPEDKFGFTERIHIRNFLLQGKGMLLLANPVKEENDSLNGRGDYLNDILRDEELGTLARFWTETDPLLSDPLNDIVKNDVNNAGIPEYLQLEINDTENAIFTDYQNVSSIVTTSCSIRSAVLNLVVASTESYAETPMKEPHLYSTNIAIFASAGRTNDFGLRIVVGGSSIMFSDIYDPILNSTWYESADNAILWSNIISWIAEASEEVNPALPLSELFLPFILGTSTIAIILILGGFMLFTIGSGRKTKVAKSKSVKIRETIEAKSDSTTLDESQASAKISKRDRRLSQIKKDKGTGKRR